MKKIKKIGLFLIGIIILPVISNILVLALPKEKSFFEIEKKEVSKEEEITMEINLDQINMDKFTFQLESNTSLENIKLEEEVENKIENENIFSFQFHKEESNLSSIILNYKLEEEIEVGDTITFTATIKKIEEEKKEKLEEEINAEENDQEETSEEEIEQEELEEELTVTYEVKVIEKKEEQEEKVYEKEKTNEKEEKQKEITSSKEKETTKVSTTQQSRTNPLTYNGSDNNYLSSLSINNYSLNKEFKKESSTYFITVDSDVDTLVVEAIQEDSNSQIYINGNTNLKTGINKILITVVAENKNTRNYRIYVTKQ